MTRDDDGFLHFEGRTDDVIISAGYRIGPFEVESALVAHDAVAEAAVVARRTTSAAASCAPSSSCATGYAPSDDLARELQDHVKASTAPYKYPRIVDFAAELPKTAERQGPPRGAARRPLSRLARHPAAGVGSPRSRGDAAR